MKRSVTRCALVAAMAMALPHAARAQQPAPRDKMEEMKKKDAMKKDAMGLEKGAMGMAMAKGEFSGADGHTTSGSYQVVEANGKRMLKTSDDLSVDPGAPDVYVVLSNGPKVGKENAVWLGKMTSHTGAQWFEIPASAKLDGMTMVVLWCKKYSATIGVAEFDAAGVMHGAMDKMDKKPDGGR